MVITSSKWLNKKNYFNRIISMHKEKLFALLLSPTKLNLDCYLDQWRFPRDFDWLRFGNFSLHLKMIAQPASLQITPIRISFRFVAKLSTFFVKNCSIRWGFLGANQLSNFRSRKALLEFIFCQTFFKFSSEPSLEFSVLLPSFTICTHIPYTPTKSLFF